MEIVTQIRAGVPPIVSVRGELDISTEGAFCAALLAVIQRHGPRVVIDLSGLSFCDPSGLGALVRTGNRAEAAGGGLSLVAPSPLVARLLRLTGLDQRFPIRPDPEGARH